MDFGGRIKEIRKSKGIKASYVAEKLGVTPARYSQIEKDATNVTLGRIEAIARILGVPLSSFFMPSDCAKRRVFDTTIIK